MAVDRPVHAPEAADGTTAPAVAVPVALGSALHGDLATGKPGVSNNRLAGSCAAPTATCRTGPLRRRPAARLLDCPCPSPVGDPDSGRHAGCPPGSADQPSSLGGARCGHPYLHGLNGLDRHPHYAILRRNHDTDALGVFHVIDSNVGPYIDAAVSGDLTDYGYRGQALRGEGASLGSNVPEVLIALAVTAKGTGYKRDLKRRDAKW